MEGSVQVEFYTLDKPLILCEKEVYVIEDIVISACKYAGIGPVSRHLFALWSTTDGLWLPLCKELTIKGGEKWFLLFKLRFRTPTMMQLLERTDSKTFNYYFHQVRADFLDGKIPELFNRNQRERALGLVAADIIRLMLELRSSPDTMKYNSKDFLPQELKRSAFWNSFLQDPLEKAVSRGWVNSRQNPEFVKEKYLQQLSDMAPDYGSESYYVLVDEDGKVYEVLLAVNPYHPTQPGVRMKVQRCKEGWTHICSIENLCYISIRNDGTVEIGRQNGIPQYVQFKGVGQMYSFVSLLDGYYRLTEKWTFNLCKDLATPTLVNLRSAKCHGPVGAAFAHEKLQEKTKNEAGSYILRESDTIYDEYCIDICSSEMENAGKPHTLKIYKKEKESFVLDGWEDSETTITKLLLHHAKKLGLKRCIPPSEYDKTNLLLCRKKNQDSQSPVARGECNCTAQCIPHNAIVLSKNNEEEFCGQLTVVHHRLLRRSSSETRAVAVKTLRRETKVTHLREFLSQCDKVLFWKHNAIVSTIGMVLTNPTSLVMEWLPVGSLDIYLQIHENNLRQVDLVEAAYHIARALWYLEEQRTCHGKIRCHNVLVASHTENSFKVKLADPGVISYTDADIHWIPPEYYDDYSQASRSTVADVYAFGTTLWQIFSYGVKPLWDFPVKEAKEWYYKGNTLEFPSGWHHEIQKLVLECWSEKDSRKLPQAIVRDINQILYEAYDSRRSHSYAMINPATLPISTAESVMKPPSLPAARPPKNILKHVFKWQTPTTNGNFAYNSLSQSAINGSSGQSTCTIETYIDRDSSGGPVNSLDSICEGEPAPDVNNANSGDLSWVIDRDRLSSWKEVGQGFYGDVNYAILTHCSGLTSEEVAVKKIRTTNQPLESYSADLRREIEIMKNLTHPNIVEIKGLVEEPETMLVMEFLKLGNLGSYVAKNKDKITCSDLFKFASDVAEGMKYLEQKRIVHRDLAARNILVASEKHVKISDFGLAQVIDRDYYRIKTERNLPIRWYALESITEGKFSHKSDVWSFGITLWEMFSYGQNPQLPNIEDTDLSVALQKGTRLGMTEKCPALVYSLMHSCWQRDSHNRPDFSQILETLHTLQSELCS